MCTTKKTRQLRKQGVQNVLIYLDSLPMEQIESENDVQIWNTARCQCLPTSREIVQAIKLRKNLILYLGKMSTL